MALNCLAIPFTHFDPDETLFLWKDIAGNGILLRFIKRCRMR
jgi:hypothetical protein